VEKLVNCPYWKEYRGINGWMMFCSAGAFAKEFKQDYAENIGCTAEQRAICSKTMKLNMGYSLLPKIVDEKTIMEKPADAATVPGKPA